MCSHLNIGIPTIYDFQYKIILKYPKSADMVFFSKGLKKEFETAMVNEPSGFEPLKVYCIYWLFPYDYKCLS